METENNFKLFQNSKKFMTNEQFESSFGTDEAYGEVGAFTYLNTSLHIIINKNGFELVLGNQIYESKDLTKLEKIFWDDFVQYEYPFIVPLTEKN